MNSFLPSSPPCEGHTSSNRFSKPRRGSGEIQPRFCGAVRALPNARQLIPGGLSSGIGLLPALLTSRDMLL